MSKKVNSTPPAMPSKVSVPHIVPPKVIHKNHLSPTSKLPPPPKK